jgi:hypothetical protein
MLKLIEKSFMKTLLVLTLMIMLTSPVAAKTAGDDPPPENLDLRDESPKKETILDLILGGEAKLPTEHGILIIDAFEDLNKNGVQDYTEPILLNQVSCTIDEISYSVPAFIPGLNYNDRYTVHCSSENYSLYSAPKDIFIERRGHVIEISLPCGAL